MRSRACPAPVTPARSRSSAPTLVTPPVTHVHPLALPEGYVLDGKLRVVRRLGTGGVGTVFEAQELATGQRVAVKVVHPAYAEVEEVIERFRREAESLASVDSPFVVAI